MQLKALFLLLAAALFQLSARAQPSSAPCKEDSDCTNDLGTSGLPFCWNGECSACKTFANGIKRCANSAPTGISSVPVEPAPTADPCASTVCKQVMCVDGSKGVVLKGECCPTCPRTKPQDPCQDIVCPQTPCPNGQKRRLQERPGSKGGVKDQCCPTCVSDPCQDAVCTQTVCADGSKGIVLDGQCCPTCPAVGAQDPSVKSCKVDSDCTDVRTRGLPFCWNGACSACRTTASGIKQCAGSVPSVPVNSDPCASTMCKQVVCADGSKGVVLKGECCPTCPRDAKPTSSPTNPCQGVACVQIVCADGMRSMQKEGECCPTCVSFTITDFSTDNTANRARSSGATTATTTKSVAASAANATTRPGTQRATAPTKSAATTTKPRITVTTAKPTTRRATTKAPTTARPTTRRTTSKATTRRTTSKATTRRTTSKATTRRTTSKATTTRTRGRGLRALNLQ